MKRVLTYQVSQVQKQRIPELCHVFDRRNPPTSTGHTDKCLNGCPEISGPQSKNPMYLRENLKKKKESNWFNLFHYYINVSSNGHERILQEWIGDEKEYKVEVETAKQGLHLKWFSMKTIATCTCISFWKADFHRRKVCYRCISFSLSHFKQKCLQLRIMFKVFALL